jgi:hypothetical protein
MTYQIVESSPKALAKVETTEDKFGIDETLSHQRSKYPWPLLRIGQSFTVSIIEGNEASLRNGAVAYAKKSGKKFTVIRHAEYSCFEVARIA